MTVLVTGAAGLVGTHVLDALRARGERPRALVRAHSVGTVEAFGAEAHPAYETLLLDCMIGDPTLFTRSDEVEPAWTLIDPVLKELEKRAGDIATYAAGSNGLTQADALIAKDNGRWH